MTTRCCTRCAVPDSDAMLAFRNGALVCADCDADLEREWVAEDPDSNRHYLDTFSPHGD